MLDHRHDSISSDRMLKEQFYSRPVTLRSREVFLILLVIVFLALSWRCLALSWNASATAQTAAIRVWVNKSCWIVLLPR
jgi:hypothetical protein